MHVLRTTVYFVVLALAWLNPFSLGPSAAMVPWLMSLACIGAVLWLVHSDIRWDDLPRNLIVFFTASALVFLWQMLWMYASAQAWASVLAWACLVTMVWVGAALPHTKSAYRPYTTYLAYMWLAVALLSVGMALSQYLRLEHWLAPWINRSDDGVAFANLRQRNQFATLCGVGLCAMLYLHQTTTQAVSTSGSIVWLWLAACVLAFGNSISGSRTGALQWLLLVALVFIWRTSLRADVRRLAYGGLAIYALAVIAMPWFAQWVGNSNTGLLGRAQEAYVPGGGRMALYSNVIDLIALKPWFGWGWRELAYAHYSTHFDVRFVELLDNAHNLPLHLAVELGVPFALAFCGVIIWAIVRNAPWRETDPTRQLAWGILMLIGVHSMVEYPLWYGPFLMTTGLCIGLLQRPVIKLNSPVVQVSTAQPAMKYVAIALLGITAYLAFDYHRVSQVYLTEADRSALYRDDVMGAAKRSVVFRQHAQFAELVTTPVTAQTAPHVLELALGLIHFSPEPRVIEPLIESATMLHFDDIAMFHLARYKAMYPKDYAAWSAVKR